MKRSGIVENLWPTHAPRRYRQFSRPKPNANDSNRVSTVGHRLSRIVFIAPHPRVTTFALGKYEMNIMLSDIIYLFRGLLKESYFFAHHMRYLDSRDVFGKMLCTRTFVSCSTRDPVQLKVRPISADCRSHLFFHALWQCNLKFQFSRELFFFLLQYRNVLNIWRFW